MQLIERYVAEARFLRAYYYTQLTSLWGDVPLITETFDINDHRGRTEKETVVNFIIDELDDIIDSHLLEVSYGSGDVGRATHGAAQSLKARVALRNECWEVVRDAEVAVVESGVFLLYLYYEGLFQYEEIGRASCRERVKGSVEEVPRHDN